MKVKKKRHIEGLEVRTFKHEVRLMDSDGSQKIVGYAAKFNELSEEMWGFREKILPGAFAGVLENSDVRALFNHDMNHVLGRQSAGTLRLWEDEVGLRYEIDPPDAQDVKDLMARLARGDIKESSFSFLIDWDEEAQEWEDHDDGTATRTIKRFSAVYDVGPVTFPAYTQTTSGVRSRGEVMAEYLKIKESRVSEQEQRETEERTARAARFRRLKRRLEIAAKS